jgi:hypothetical protein
MSHRDLIHSAIATGVAELATLPICTLKTNYQNTNAISIPNTIRYIYRQGGLRAFYKASLPALGSQVISTSSKYTLYRYFQTLHLPSSRDPLPNFVCGFMGGLLSTLITHPLDVIKIHLQMRTPFLSELKRYGPYVFYRGYSKTFGKIGISSMMFFPLYDWCQTNVHSPIVASMISATISTTIMTPIDYLKTRHIYNQPLLQGWNPLTYYKGWTLNLMRIVPHFTILMTIVDALNKIK